MKLKSIWSKDICNMTAAIMAATLSFAGTAQAQTSNDPVAITVTYNTTETSQLPIWVAQDAGLFKKHGLNVSLKMIPNNNLALNTLIGGQSNITHVAGGGALSAIAGGVDLVVVGVLGPVHPYFLYVPDSIKTIDNMKGKRIGVSSIGDAVYIAASVALRKLGLDPKSDVVFVTTGSHENRTAAMMTGAIQGEMESPPATYTLDPRGFHPLFDVAALKIPAANVAIVLNRSYLNANRDTVQRYVDAIVESLTRIRNDKPFTVTVMKKYMHDDDDVAISKTYDFMVKEVLPQLPYPAPEQFADSKTYLSPTVPGLKDVDLSKIIDRSFVQSAASRGLDK